MQMHWLSCNLPPPGDSNRVLGLLVFEMTTALAGRSDSFMKELQSANAVDNVIRMVSPSGGLAEDLNKEGFSR
jgi:hypothetical protein